MAEAPAFPLWTDAYLADTGHLTTIEHGAYLLLLMTMWRAGGSLPNDDKLLAKYARMTAGQWQRVKPTLMAFFQVSSDSITQGRLTDELVYVRQKSKTQSDNARSKYRKNNKTIPATAQPKGETAEPKGSQLDAPTPTPSSSLRSEQDSYHSDFETAWQCYPRREGGNPKKGAFAAWKARLKAGYTAGQMTEGVRRYASYVERSGTHPRFVMQAQKFFGPEDPPHFTLGWEIDNEPDSKKSVGGFDNFCRAMREEMAGE